MGCPAPDPAMWISVVKVTNIPQEDLVEIVGNLELMTEIQPVGGWSTSRDGGPHRIVREGLRQ